MPTYDYKCQACGHTFDLFQYMNEKPRKKCPGCGRMTLVRLIGTGAGIIFKGAGFYETDYKRKNGAPAKADAPACGEKSCPKQADCPAAKSESDR